MPITRIYEDDKTIIKVVEEDGDFSFGFYSDTGPTIFRSSLEEEKAVRYFNIAVRTYLSDIDNAGNDKITLSILNNFPL